MARSRILLIALVVLALHSATPTAAPGLVAAFEQEGRKDRAVVPQLALHTPRGEAPSALLQPGPFTVELSGWLTAELRAQYSFEAEASGPLTLSINGKVILDTASTNRSEPVRLSKGTNAIFARFAPDRTRDAALRLFWSPRSAPLRSPIPASALSHDEGDAELERSSQIRRGAELFADYRCGQCHNMPSAIAPAFDAPSFDGIGSRLQPGWMAEWIENPQAHQAGARMPRLFRGELAKNQARNAAAFLASLTADPAPPPPQPAAAKEVDGARLYADLRCASCHASEPAAIADGAFNLDHLARKFRPSALADYLRAPEAHYAWTGMPNFQLTDAEGASLSLHLQAGPAPSAKSEPPPRASVDAGRALIQTSGCLNCHAAKLENRFPAKPLAALKDFAAGCLAGAAPPGAAEYPFSPGDAEALRAFLEATAQGARFSLAPAEFARWQLQRLRCAACHDAASGLPPLPLAGAKLQARWMRHVLSGTLHEKPRPWLAARMPAFPAYAEILSRGLAAEHGHPPVPAPRKAEASAGAELITAGAQLLSAEGGFACVSCHALARRAPAPSAESPGLSLALSAERLHRDYFERWLLNPAALDPATKMPAYFDAQGRSQLLEIFGGDGRQQINALWLCLQESAGGP